MNIDKFLARNHALLDMDDSKKTLSYRIRSYLRYKLGIWDMWDLLPYSWRHYYYDYVRPIFKPCHGRIRKSIPKTWSDISCLAVNVNFEMIKSFYEGEYKNGHVDWQSDDWHKEFAEWLESAYKYITVERPELEVNLSNAYPSVRLLDRLEETYDSKGNKMYTLKDDGIPYEVKYAEVNMIEKAIYDRDTDVLTQFIKRRDFFWT